MARKDSSVLLKHDSIREIIASEDAVDSDGDINVVDDVEVMDTDTTVDCISDVDMVDVDGYCW